jgi:hypothetical protein
MHRPSPRQISDRAEALWRAAAARNDWRQFSLWAECSSHLTLKPLMRALAARDGAEYGSLLLDDMWDACLQEAESALFAELGQPDRGQLEAQYRDDDCRARLPAAMTTGISGNVLHVDRPRSVGQHNITF